MLSLEIGPNAVSVGVATQSDINCENSLLFIHTQKPTAVHNILESTQGHDISRFQ